MGKKAKSRAKGRLKSTSNYSKNFSVRFIDVTTPENFYSVEPRLYDREMIENAIGCEINLFITSELKEANGGCFIAVTCVLETLEMQTFTACKEGAYIKNLAGLLLKIENYYGLKMLKTGLKMLKTGNLEDFRTALKTSPILPI
ncbi:hypothetical protein [Okeania sp. SIO1I7]|uniref:hypothetical protein n=1 Tax=Okeania sp. SIO1I7 TaxID=2607772 RepID=UPI0013FA7FE8|nr:hypothetical protein [Okeania sp. SIO1I7]NET29961.1 hypothetical protein [Okeania sp. SIO1I7]